MNYNVKLIKRESYKPTFWSGGMATELITYPSNSDFSKRNFLWRLGVAKIDIPESTFSNLPNVSRKFMVTEGQITLEHEDKYAKLLKPFDQDSFTGDWNTKTYGKASVFNLMTKENYNGELIHINIIPKKQHDFKYKTSFSKDLIAMCFYAINGSFTININNKLYKVNNNDLLLLNDIAARSLHEFTFISNCLEPTNIIASIIYRQ